MLLILFGNTREYRACNGSDNSLSFGQFLYVADREHGNVRVFSLGGDLLATYQLGHEFGPVFAVEATRDALYAVSFPLGPGFHFVKSTTCSPFLLELSLYESPERTGEPHCRYHTLH